jgi:hypothetical protein
MPRRRSTLADKEALLSSGKPFIVHPREVAKCTAAYRTDPEVLLGCIIVSSTLDTAIVLRAELSIHHGLPISPEAREPYGAFRRVWRTPSAAERTAVLKRAEWIVANARGRPRRRGDFQWSTPN